MENLVFLHLKRNYDEVFFDSNTAETDFVIKEGMRITRRVQVWYDDTERTEIPERELSCFNVGGNRYEGAECLLITNDLKDTIEAGSNTVYCIPLAKFLLFD